MNRGQASMPALAVALVVLTSTAVLAFAIADGAYAGAARDPDQRRVADALADRLVSAEGPLTDRANVVNATRLRRLDERLDGWYPVAAGRAVRIRLDDELLVDRGRPRGPSTRRVVLVRREQRVTRRPMLVHSATTLPRRTDRVTLGLAPPRDTTIRTVRANDRVVLHDPSGLEGTYRISVSRLETVRLAFAADGPLPRGSVTVTSYPARTTKATLEVTVGA